MKQYSSSLPLFSIHIPKSGGTSFKRLLGKWFNEKLFFHYFDEKENRMPQKYDLQKGICIHGHCNHKRGFGFQDYYSAISQCIMILRDPFEIITSRYYFIKRLERYNNSFRDGKVFTLPDDIVSFIEEEINNPDYHPNILDYMPEQMNLKNYEDIINNYFVYIGIMEDYQTSINKLAQKLGFQNHEIEHTNISERDRDLPLRLRRDFIDKHPLEYAVYEYVVQHYKDW